MGVSCIMPVGDLYLTIFKVFLRRRYTVYYRFRYTDYRLRYSNYRLRYTDYRLRYSYNRLRYTTGYETLLQFRHSNLQYSIFRAR